LNVGIISYYKLDETSGTTAYDSLGVNNGFNNGATINVAGKINTAYDFDGSNDYVLMDSAFQSGSWSEVSVSAWFYQDSRSDFSPIIYSRGSKTGYLSFLESDDSFFGFSVAGDVNDRVKVASSTLNIGEWIHAVGTYDGTTMRLYINGLNVANRTVSSTINFTGTSYIGYDPAISTRKFNGKIDEVAIWNRALTNSEISLLYNSGNGLTLPGDFPPSITLNSPISTNYTTSPQNIQMNFTAWDDVNLSDVKLYVNGVLNQTMQVD
jgi:hypothetical protein